ncbi:hypothetical protein CJD36_004650 [Flavipsychrobacter stenotrophus]|uniref:Type II toxin-antitoxin system RelE/ParE family toxin n=1 Tax=Flavipsychrobacter stenotrophus TaxID=2077091 RepID=A0A2S7T281_9BACT|nr:hypothetical protein CJD36_004650 [Flavipsychrobacter stenotrophus]
MTYNFTISPRAATQYREAVLWYIDKSILAGRNFDFELNEKIREICLHPTLYRNTVKKFREANLRVFPFTVVYKIDEKNHLVIITSIFHNKRNPIGKYPV